MKIQLLVEAEAELTETSDWYDQQAIGLGMDFLKEFDAAVCQLVVFPKLFQELLPGIRRCQMNRFPCSVMYKVDADHVLILAVAHHKRKPMYRSTRKP